MLRVSEVRVALRTDKRLFNGLLARVANLLGSHGVVTGVHGGHNGNGTANAFFLVESLDNAEQMPAWIP